MSSQILNLENYAEPTKEPKTNAELVELLEARGLVFDDKIEAIRKLNECHYYRLLAYRFPFLMSGSNDNFRAGTRFDDLWNLYVSDRKLRLLLMDAIERLEVSLRSHWAHILSLEYGALAYENCEIHSGKYFAQLLSDVHKAILSSKEPCIRHFLDNPETPQRPPIWAVCEILTEGQLISFLNSLSNKDLKRKIFASYGIDTIRMCSILGVIRNVRNICAHHGRLWNKQLFFSMKFPKNPKILADSLVENQKSIYNVIVILIWLLRVIAPQSSWEKNLKNFVLPQPDFVRAGMGFPKNWQDLPIWK